MTEAPVLGIDPFDEEVLRAPDPVHQRLREAGPVVRLERYGIWSMARFAEVQAALRDHQAFCSGAGAGLRGELALQATGLVADLAARGTFDAVPDLAQAYPMRVFPDAVGLRPDGRENLLTYGTMVFNAFWARASTRASGAALARLEGELLLTAMARQLTSLELAGPVRPYLNNTIKGLAGLPVPGRAA